MTFLWRILSSERLAALLVISMSLATGIAAVVPQGDGAIELARDPGANTLHTLFALGLTDVFDSAWVKVIGSLLAGNIVMILVRRRHEGGLGLTETPPSGAPLAAELRADKPEHAVEILREAFVSRVGLPRFETAKGPRVSLVFDSGAGASFAPLVTHLGLLVAVLAAGLEVSTVDPKDTAPAAILRVTDPTSGIAGHFNMVAGEPFQFFQFSARYILKDYVSNRGGLGPAVRVERTGQGAREASSIWIYAKAPEGFDQRHRGGEVHIEAESMGMRPVPGKGLTRKPTGALLLLGFALVAFGALRGQAASGRLWVVADGASVTIVGEPTVAGDRDFERRFEQWTLEAKEILGPT
ncbi:MAG: hypothetical protein HYV07_26655 [Deltaproteobacteria bacterium]|nr:hypothetical protein [Deltaproteobacteria bacterium]